MCFNAIELNAITKPLHRHVPGTMQVIDELSAATHYSLIDLKGAFHNIPIVEEA